MRTCSKCNQTKPLSEFHCGGTINGKTYVRGDCKVCQRKVVKNRAESIKQNYISWKKTLKCNRCGNNDHRTTSIIYAASDLHADDQPNLQILIDRRRSKFDLHAD